MPSALRSVAVVAAVAGVAATAATAPAAAPKIDKWVGTVDQHDGYAVTLGHYRPGHKAVANVFLNCAITAPNGSSYTGVIVQAKGRYARGRLVVKGRKAYIGIPGVKARIKVRAKARRGQPATGTVKWRLYPQSASPGCSGTATFTGQYSLSRGK